MCSSAKKIHVKLSGAPETMLATVYARALDADASHATQKHTNKQKTHSVRSELGHELLTRRQHGGVHDFVLCLLGLGRH